MKEMVFCSKHDWFSKRPGKYDWYSTRSDLTYRVKLPQILLCRQIYLQGKKKAFLFCPIFFNILISMLLLVNVHAHSCIWKKIWKIIWRISMCEYNFKTPLPLLSFCSSRSNFIKSLIIIFFIFYFECFIIYLTKEFFHLFLQMKIVYFYIVLQWDWRICSFICKQTTLFNLNQTFVKKCVVLIICCNCCILFGLNAV